MAVKDGVLETQWQSAYGRSRATEMVLPGSSVKKYRKSSVQDLREGIWMSERLFT
jgi:hypothetical protein